MIKKWSITIPELTGPAERSVYVHVPDEWEDDPDQRYPVLYMFDGHNVFFDEDATYGKSWGMADYLEETGIPLIVVGVECNHDPNNGRLSEYSPFTFQNRKLGYVAGRGHITMNWLVNTLKPYIDETFPTLPEREYTFIAGSSMGGLMSLYAVTAYNHIFSRAAALSPSVWFATERLDRLLRTAPIAPDTVIYMDYGSNELPRHSNMARQFSRVAQRLLERRVNLTCRIVPEGEHSEESWEAQIPFFMDILFYGLDY